MRIAYVTEIWPPEVNSVALNAARTVGDLRRRGHSVDLIRPRRHHDEQDGEHCILTPCLSMPMRQDMRVALPAKKNLWRRWTEKRPDIVHVATEGLLGWSACSAALALGIPVTSDFHSRLDEYGKLYAIRASTPAVRNYLRIFHNRTATTFVPTEEARVELNRNGFRNLLVSGRGVNSIAFAPTYRSETLRRQWNATGPVALYVGRLAPEKNMLAVINAFEAMRAATPDTRLVIVGDGPMRAELLRRCPDAIFAGVQRGATLATYYASADVFLFASLTETFGDVTLEAMASGLAVVAYHTAAAATYIENGVSGLTAVCGNESDFNAAAVCLAKNEKLREQIGRSARTAARKAGWERNHMEFEAALFSTAMSEQADVRACLGLA